MYTVLIYLNTPEEGGGTHFPDLNLTVMPELGRAVMWPNVLDVKPTVTDMRLYHKALPVTKGVKFAVNFWVYMYDYHKPRGAHMLCMRMHTTSIYCMHAHRMDICILFTP